MMEIVVWKMTEERFRERIQIHSQLYTSGILLNIVSMFEGLKKKF